MIDPFHLEAYGKTAINYNRDVEIFPVLKAMMEAIYNKSFYKSPTDMGVNMAGFAIINDKAAVKASKNEIIRRYLASKVDLRNGKIKEAVKDKIALLMRELNISVDDRLCVKAAEDKKALTNTPSMAIELSDKTIIDSKTSDLLSAPAALILNALKHLAGVPDDMILLSPSIIEPISKMKIECLHNHNPRLHADEVLIALSISAQYNPMAELCMKKIELLKGCQAHSTVILNQVDTQVFKKLNIDLTTDIEMYAHKLYTK
jgi:uncharacterized protein (UPF0371 family)